MLIVCQVLFCMLYICIYFILTATIRDAKPYYYPHLADVETEE